MSARRKVTITSGKLWLLVPILGLFRVAAASDFYVSPFGSSIPPYNDWPTAATNIQDAINAASAGDTVWVTNGVYASGGKVMAGDLTNRVALNKALTVQSVNGPWATAILGAGAPPGATAARCAWLTNGALLSGFTLRGGATRNAGDTATLESGGGVWCASSNAVVANCVLTANIAQISGGGAYQGTFYNCGFITNRGSSFGGGAYNAILGSCTIVGNASSSSAAYTCKLTNCIAFFNSGGNFGSSTLAYCCTSPSAPGVGNIAVDPQLIGDGIHLSSASPCRGAGTNVTYGADIDGQAWANPPSIGCDEWVPEPVATLQPLQLSNVPPTFSITGVVAGQEPFYVQWLKDGTPIEDNGYFSGTHTTSLVGSLSNPQGAGFYQLMAGNAFGVATSTVARLIVHCVDVSNTAPMAPYTTWATAATNVQDAIDAAVPGEPVLVTNGIYATGGKVMGGNLTNRVVVDKPTIVLSVNGAATTIILGAWDPLTNGPTAIRCAWLTNAATLAGFTLEGGATRPLGGPQTQQMNGGGVWGSSNSALVVNCVLATNSAGNSGGGAFQVLLVNSTLIGNISAGNSPGTSLGGSGGGAANCNLRNCNVTANYASNQGGGAYNCGVTNCAFTRNTSGWQGGGLFSTKAVNSTIVNNVAGTPFVGTSGRVGMGGGAYVAFLTNCIVVQNVALYAQDTSSNYNGNLGFCCSFPLPPGAGNISVDPNLLLDGVHLSQNSPCIGTGLASIVTGLDIDQQLWANPPSIGCDEWKPVPIVGVQPEARVSGIPPTLGLGSEVIAGQEPFSYAWMKNSAPLSDDSHYASTHSAYMTIANLGPADAGSYQVVVSNAFGLATGTVQVVIHCVDSASTAPAAPYATWTTAATTIQDALDLSRDGEIVLVTNGLYSSAGRAMAGDLTNRVSLATAVSVSSMSGPAMTIIQGQWDPLTTNGPLAVRCVWLANGASLNGFTLRGGATRTNGDAGTFQGGGGVWCASTNAVVANCIISNNAASVFGGGCYQGEFDRCVFSANACRQLGGGAYSATLYNCLLSGNSAGEYGGGASAATLFNCTVTANVCLAGGGGTEQVYGFNCIVSSNIRLPNIQDNWYNLLPGPGFSNSCTTPLPAGIGNIAADPQLLDGIHLAVISPCRGAGNPIYVSGVDIDGEPWANPPSMGCDEVWEAALTGPITVSASAAWPTVAAWGSLPLSGSVFGRATRVGWDFGDGSILTNASYVNTSHVWTNPGDYVVTFTGFNMDNPSGVSTNLGVHVIPLVAPALSSGGLIGMNFSFSFPGQPGVSYILEQATNLTEPVLWQTVSTLTSTGALMQVTDKKATNAARFYRARIQTQ